MLCVGRVFKFVACMMLSIVCVSTSACGSTVDSVGEDSPVEKANRVSAGREYFPRQTSISAVKAPVFCHTFSTAQTGAMVLTVYWGALDNSAEEGSFFWGESSFPGFDFPIIIETTEDGWGNTVLLQTEYGQYRYTKLNCSKCFKVDRELIDAFTGKKLVAWTVPVENLYVYFPEKGKVFVYSLENGTEIRSGW